MSIARNRAIRDAIEQAEALDKVGIVGYGIVELFDKRGWLKEVQPFSNLITDAGDLYYASKMIVGISPASPSAPTAVNGMKLGTGAGSPTKASTNAALVTYLTASNVVFDATFPSTTNLGTTLGVNAVYKTTWGAGVATNAAITEAVIVNDQATNATSTAPNTISRTLFGSSVNKGASDTLAITWNHKALGA